MVIHCGGKSFAVNLRATGCRPYEIATAVCTLPRNDMKLCFMRGGMRSSRPTVKTQFRQNVGRCSLTPPQQGCPRGQMPSPPRGRCRHKPTDEVYIRHEVPLNCSLLTSHCSLIKTARKNPCPTETLSVVRGYYTLSPFNSPKTFRVFVPYV